MCWGCAGLVRRGALWSNLRHALVPMCFRNVRHHSVRPMSDVSEECTHNGDDELRRTWLEYVPTLAKVKDPLVVELLYKLWAKRRILRSVTTSVQDDSAVEPWCGWTTSVQHLIDHELEAAIEQALSEFGVILVEPLAGLLTGGGDDGDELFSRALNRVAEGSEDLPLLVRLLSFNAVGVAVSALMRISALGERAREASPAVIRLMQRPELSGTLVMPAINALVSIGDKTAVAAISPWLESRNSRLRDAAFTAICELGGESDEILVRKARTDLQYCLDDAERRSRAIGRLVSVGRNGVPALLEIASKVQKDLEFENWVHHEEVVITEAEIDYRPVGRGGDLMPSLVSEGVVAPAHDTEEGGPVRRHALMLLSEIYSALHGLGVRPQLSAVRSRLQDQDQSVREAAEDLVRRFN